MRRMRRIASSIALVVRAVSPAPASAAATLVSPLGGRTVGTYPVLQWRLPSGEQNEVVYVASRASRASTGQHPGRRAGGARDAERHRAVTPRRSACTIANTAPTTSTAPTSSSIASDSESTSAPSAIATTGLTYWCVTTVEIGRCASA